MSEGIKCIIIAMLFLFPKAFGKTESYQMEIQKNLEIDLKTSPKSLDVESPDKIFVSKGNGIGKIIVRAKKPGESKIIVNKKNGSIDIIKIKVIDRHENLRTVSKKPPLTNQSPTSTLFQLASQLAEDLTQKCGVASSVEGSKIVTHGKISNFDVLTCLFFKSQQNSDAFVFSHEIDAVLFAELKNLIAIFLDLEDIPQNIEAQKMFVKISLNESQATNLSEKIDFLRSFCSCFLFHTKQLFSAEEISLRLRFLEISKHKMLEIGGRFPELFSSTPSSGPQLHMSSNLAVKPLIGSFDLLFKALEDKGALQHLAEPTLLVRQGSKAHFLAGGEVPIVTEINAKDGARFRTEYKPYGIQISVELEEFIRKKAAIAVEAQISSLDPSFSLQEGTAFKSRKIETKLTLDEGRSAMLSGLVESKDSKSSKMIPWLGNIPILGHLFKSNQGQKEQSEIWILLEHLTKVPDSAAEAQRDAKNFPKAFGDFSSSKNQELVLP